MALQILIMSIICMFLGFAATGCCYSRVKEEAATMSQLSRGCASGLALLPLVGGLIGLLWCLLSPPPFSKRVSGPPAHHRNDPRRSIYLGNGCFWHTQYDFVIVEWDPNGVFGRRNFSEITSLVGYAGGRYQSPSGTACYHGLPGTDYDKLGHSEAVSVTLDEASGSRSQAQVAAIAKAYFDHGFNSMPDGRRQRKDPQDAGPAYRNVIGLPGGMNNAEWWPLIQAANVYGMPLVSGAGGPGDNEDDHIVYVYDSVEFPFFRGEDYHQFHTNDVLGRPVPRNYTGDLKDAQRKIGRLDDDIGCTSVIAEVGLLIVFCFALLFGIGAMSLHEFLPQRLRFWERCTDSTRDVEQNESE
eukprot:gnl/MRDRNA2_/MRDRNA2_276017_c0_seq1.p1 gnl/MRDRNA2_/MRDRNA2_276017_c0~~gnl/MRDRNA2_/MRDRNA2_276017_c0_seq1.p1  ORF type:complete len:356 (+),score=49.24 gnl/MRDRNA2_/MRDRNA2_276017_c0_seq1:112-1179(+)